MLRSVPTALAMLVVLGTTSAGLATATESVWPSGTFSATVTGLEVHVAVTSSTPADAEFCWEFGELPPDTWGGGAMLCSTGEVAFGPTARHTYEAAGTYTITLTVLANAIGDAAIVTQQVTVSGTAANQSPTVSFATSVSGLAVAVDGATSRDPDLTVTSQ
jgi:hypothetical protein